MESLIYIEYPNRSKVKFLDCSLLSKLGFSAKEIKDLNVDDLSCVMNHSSNSKVEKSHASSLISRLERNCPGAVEIQSLRVQIDDKILTDAGGILVIYLQKRQGINSIIVQLTEQERKVCALICSGDKNQEIANKLNISVYTVDTHRKNLMKKLNIIGAANLVRVALENNLF